MVSLWKILLLPEILLSLNFSKDKEMVKEKEKKKKKKERKKIRQSQSYRSINKMFILWEVCKHLKKSFIFWKKILMSKNMPYKMVKYKGTWIKRLWHWLIHRSIKRTDQVSQIMCNWSASQKVFIGQISINNATFFIHLLEIYNEFQHIKESEEYCSIETYLNLHNLNLPNLHDHEIILKRIPKIIFQRTLFGICWNKEYTNRPK